jgi:hypothetical protein
VILARRDEASEPPVQRKSFLDPLSHRHSTQALDFREPQKTRPGRGVIAAHELIRSRVPHMETDRELHRDIAAVAALVDTGELLATVRSACYDSRA